MFGPVPVRRCAAKTPSCLITAKGLTSLEMTMDIPWTTLSSSSSGESKELQTMVSSPSPRSPYAVLRSLGSPVGQCATDLLTGRSVKFDVTGCSSPICACSALIYPSSAMMQNENSTNEASLLTFVMALKLSQTEKFLISNPEFKYIMEALVGKNLSEKVAFVNLCADPSGYFTEEVTHIIAHTLLSGEESNKLKWFNEESRDLSKFYNRAPSLRMLYVMWSSAKSTGSASKAPSHAEITDVLDRMVGAKLPFNMGDLAALYLFGVMDDLLTNDVAKDFLWVFKSKINAHKATGNDLSVEDGLKSSLVLLFLLKYAERLLSSESSYFPSSPPVALFNSTSEISYIMHKYLDEKKVVTIDNTGNVGNALNTVDIIHELNRHLLQKLDEGVYQLAARCDVPEDNKILADVTTWLLRENPSSESAKKHFTRLTSVRPNEASVALVESGILSGHMINLQKVVSVLLPLLSEVSDEDFYASTIRDIISSLEERLRKLPDSFTNSDLKLLAEFGTHIFTVGSGDENSVDSSFDATARGQMEELQVMDGSPLSLCRASFRSIKEMAEGLVKDHRRLKRQLEKQMRNIGLPGMPGAEGNAPNNAAGLNDEEENMSATDKSASASGKVPGRAVEKEEDKNKNHLTVPAPLRQRYLVFIEQLVKSEIDERKLVVEHPMVVCSELFSFVNRHVPVPNIQDEYRRKIFLLVNVAEDPETERRRRIELRKLRRETQRRQKKNGAVEEDEEDEELASGGENEIPAELRFLVSSLPLTLSPWASVMILREVVSESAGNNPRYTYVLNSAIDLQLPISTTRSRIATTYNMWRFLSTQSNKLSLKESLLVKQRCLMNLPLAYILSSYWSLLAWVAVATITLLNVFGIDFESQLVANTLFQKFAPYEEVDIYQEVPENGGNVQSTWQKEAAMDLASKYLEQDELSTRMRGSATEVVLSSASYLFLGYDDQRRPMTLIPISSNPKMDWESRMTEEYAGASAVLRELSLHVPFPFFVDLERPLPHELVIARVAERIRRVSFNNTWFLPRMIIRTFPLGRQYTERSLVSHTCSQANLTRRRVTFLFYIHQGVPVTPTFLQSLYDSMLSESANLVIVLHEDSLKLGNIQPNSLDKILKKKDGEDDAYLDDETRFRVLPFSRSYFHLKKAMKPSSLSPAGARGGGTGFSIKKSKVPLSPYTQVYGIATETKKSVVNKKESETTLHAAYRFVMNPVRFVTNKMIGDEAPDDLEEDSSDEAKNRPGEEANINRPEGASGEGESLTRTVVSVPLKALKEAVTTVQSVVLSENNGLRHGGQPTLHNIRSDCEKLEMEEEGASHKSSPSRASASNARSADGEFSVLDRCIFMRHIGEDDLKRRFQKWLHEPEDTFNQYKIH